jgi:hypothetical protein
MTKSHGNDPSDGAPPLFKALGLPDTDDSAAELAFCRTLIQAHLRRIPNLDSKAMDTLINIVADIQARIY